MRVYALPQPFDAQGRPSWLQTTLIDLIGSPEHEFQQITLVSAFANRQGILRILPSIHRATATGVQFTLILGVDHRGTSIEALRSLVDNGIPTVIYHNSQPGHTFHPKLFVFEAPNSHSTILLGSNNLTHGGLVSNYEAAIRLDLDLSQEIDRHVFSDLSSTYQRYLDIENPCARELTVELVEMLIARGTVVTEDAQRLERATRGDLDNDARDEGEIPPDPFAAEAVERPPGVVVERPAELVRDDQPIPQHRDFGSQLWEKDNLPASDVQRQPGNPTGGVRLTQAGWQVEGNTIDQTTYFRNEAFGELAWSVGTHSPRQREATLVPARVLILGHDYGVRQFVVSHKPSGEAGQGNYTTMLHWGEFGETIQALDLVGRTLRLFTPSEGEDEPFLLEIL